MADNLFNATPADKRDILLIKGAGHGEAVIKDNQTYFNKIDNFSFIVHKILKSPIY